ISDADFGNIQILDPKSSDLRIKAQRGFPEWWIDFWNSVSRGQGACGTALERGERIIVEDIEQSPIFVGTPALEIQLKAGVRAVQATPLISRSGRPLGMFSTHYTQPHRPDDRALRLLDLLARQAADIIERSQAEATLQTNLQRFYAILSSMYAGILLVTDEGQIEYANQAFCSMFDLKDSPSDLIGLTSDQMIGLIKNIYWHPEEATARIMELVHLGQPVKGEEVAIKGERTYLRDFVPLYVGGRSYGRLWHHLDITERKRSEESLREVKEYLENLINHANAPIIVWDSSFRITRFNNAFEKLTGLKASEVLGSYLEILFPDGSKKDSMNLIQSTLAGERWEAVEIPILRADGSTRIVLWNSANILSQDGTNVVATIAQGQDITERKRIEIELEQMVLERTAELSLAKEELEITNEALKVEIEDHKQLELDLLKARDKAQDAARTKSTFMANMSHEIRTPMNSVIGMTSLLLDEDLNPEQKDYVETIRTGGEALLTIINDILDFSKLEQDKTELEYQPFNLRSTIEEAIDLIAAKAAEKKLNLAYTVDKATPCSIIGDPTRLRQILAILLDNAVKFTEKGEILLSVSSDHSDSQYEIHFAVKDTGIGIDSAKIDKLFESFSQLDDSIATKYGGTGLGLSISKKLVELMGGKIWVEGDIGKGSTFHFTMLANAVSGKLTSVIEPKLKGKRILIVEDNKTNRRILGRQARDWGMMPTTVGSSREALKLIRGEDIFDVAIIEKDLDELDGLALAQEIRRNNKTMPLVILTFLGQGVESDLFAATLTKPIKPTQFYETLIDSLAPPLVPSMILTPEVSLASKTMRILLAEDNLSSQKVTLQMLKKLGHRSDVVANGREVLEALGRQRYDLILMDVRMPEMNGLEATRIIRQRWPDKGPTIIAVTAYGLQGDRERCLEAGMDDYISKPVQLEDLGRMLSKHIPARQSKKALFKGQKKRR
ncbi:MAG: response regulator, partial [Methanotrichaceae archaeon]|nr:response regulator [Methanotrichaceae archaeon]